MGENLGRYAGLLLDSPAVALVREMAHDLGLSEAMDAKAAETGVVGALETAVARYLAAEKDRGRVAADVDERAFGFVIAGAIHNLLVSGDVYPRPTRRRLERMLTAVAERLATRGGSKERNAIID